MTKKYKKTSKRKNNKLQPLLVVGVGVATGIVAPNTALANELPNANSPIEAINSNSEFGNSTNLFNALDNLAVSSKQQTSPKQQFQKQDDELEQAITDIYSGKQKTAHDFSKPVTGKTIKTIKSKKAQSETDKIIDNLNRSGEAIESDKITKRVSTIGVLNHDKAVTSAFDDEYQETNLDNNHTKDSNQAATKPIIDFNEPSVFSPTVEKDKKVENTTIVDINNKDIPLKENSLDEIVVKKVNNKKSHQAKQSNASAVDVVTPMATAQIKVPNEPNQQTLNNVQDRDRVILSEVRVINLHAVKPTTLMRGLQIGSGSPYSVDMNPIIERQLMDSGFFKSVQVQLDKEKAILYITVQENAPVALVKVNGAKVIKGSDIKSNLAANNIGEGGVLNPPLLNEVGKDIKDEYVKYGKENPKITISFDQMTEQDYKENPHSQKVSAKLANQKATPAKVIIDIDEGETTKIKTINFTGNQAFSSTELKRMMSSDELGSVEIMSFGSTYNPERLKSDFDNILNKYKDKGYANASIPKVQMSDVGTIEKPLKQIDVHIQEGRQYLFGQPEFIVSENSQHLIDVAQLKKLNKIKAGTLFNRTKLISTQKSIERHLTNQGYPFAKVEVNFKEFMDNGKLYFAPLLMVNAYQEANIRNVNVRGLTKTKADAVQKEIRVKSGDKYNQQKLEVSTTKLQQTGFFNEVDVKAQPIDTDKDGSPDAVDVNIDVKERRTGKATVSAGYQQNSGAVVTAALSDTNAFGTGKTMGAEVSYNKAQREVNLLYSDPHLFGIDRNFDISLYGSDYNPNKIKNNNSDYRLKRYGVNATVGVPVSDFNKIYLGLNAEQMDLSIASHSAPLQYRDFIIKHGDGNSRFKGKILKATASWSHDTTTNPYWGESGHIARIGAEATLPASDVKYAKAHASYKQFIPLADKATLMLHAQGGIGKGMGKNKDFPFFETFQAGGMLNTPVRAFDAGTIGPKVLDNNGDLVTLGGTRMLGGTVEVNTKVPFLKDSTDVRIGGFVDVASVWDGKNHVRANNEQYKSTMKEEVRAAVGVAWTWNSPVGAIKLSYATPIKRKDGDQVQRFQFTLGKTF